MDALHEISAYQSKRRRKKRWQSVVAGLAAVVVFCTTYALILPAITMSQETFCGKQEHQHGEDCYGLVLVCEKEYDEVPTEGHVHDDSCYEWQTELVCEEQEREDAYHEHTEACYDEEGNLICEEPSFTPGHTHTQDCYEERQILICGEEEAEPELVRHIHTEACFAREFTCTLEEHTHSAICYSDRSADLESAAVWEGTLPELTGKTTGDDVALVAESQLGYTQSRRNFDVDDAGGRHGYTRYGAWYGYPYGEWCAMFASFCLHYAGVSQNDFPYASGCVYWIEQLREDGLYETAAEAAPKRGDLVFFDTDADGVSDHVGVLSAVKGEKLETIEGNISGAVVRRHYASDDASILGFGVVPDEKALPAEPDREEPSTEEPQPEIPAEGEDEPETQEPSQDEAEEEVPAEDEPQPEDPAQDASEEENPPEEEQKQELICALRQHEHTDACYSAKGELICGLEEHTHTQDCYAPSGSETGCACYDEDGARVCEDDCACSCHENGADLIELSYAGDGYEITLSWTGDTSSAEDTELSVREIEPETGEYEDYIAKTVEALVESGQLEQEEELPFASFFDLTLLQNGEPVEPDAPVTVSIHYDEDLLQSVEELQVVHFTDDTADVLPAETSEGEYSGTDIVYEQDSLSVVGVFAAQAVPNTAPDGPSKSGATTATVKFIWTDGAGAHTDDEVTIALYKDGQATGLTGILSGENDWTYIFTDLDPEGEYAVQYTTLSGYTYAEKVDAAADAGSWTQTDALEDGNIYAIVYQSSGVTYAVQDSGSLSRGQVRVEGDSITDVTIEMGWNYSGGVLKNMSTGKYLQLSYSGRRYSWTVSNSGSTITYANGKISARSGNTTRYLGDYNSAVTSSNNATTYTLYKLSSQADELLFTITASRQGVYDPSQPTTGGGMPRFEHNKTIDYLGDGVLNPDTTLSGKEDYRLYLDMVGRSEAIDLLLVVDGSGSMVSNSDAEIGGQTMRRDQALTKFLNGSTGSATDDGFISYFLGLNEENRFSVVQFYGDASYTPQGWNGYENVSQGYPGYTADSHVLQDWTSDVTFVDCTAKSNNGTNYEAGFKMASAQFAAGDTGHRKIMIFLSDGVPTYFIIDQSDIDTDYQNSTLSSYLPGNLGERFGTGLDKGDDGANYANCKAPTLQAFAQFQQENPEVTVFTVGFAKGFNDTTNKAEVLEDMAAYTNGTYYQVTDSMDDLEQQLESIFYPKGVTITDELSRYVRFYGEQPDVKVTMTNRWTQEETILWENGQSKGVSVTVGGREIPIFERVEYTQGDTAAEPSGSTGSVKAVFGSEYCMSPDYIYTLSFNVHITQTAYNEYRTNGNGYGDVVGEDETDYGANLTSSNQPGFHSNTEAYVNYSVNGSYYRDTYKHPVVQVESAPYDVELPHTGGIGTFWFTAGGALLAALSLMLLCIRRRRREGRP